MPTDPAPPAEPWRDPRPRTDARRLDDFVAAELARLSPFEETEVPVRRRGEPMPPTRETPAYRAWLSRRATAP